MLYKIFKTKCFKNVFIFFFSLIRVVVILLYILNILPYCVWCIYFTYIFFFIMFVHKHIKSRQFKIGYYKLEWSNITCNAMDFVSYFDSTNPTELCKLLNYVRLWEHFLNRGNVYKVDWESIGFSLVYPTELERLKRILYFKYQVFRSKTALVFQSALISTVSTG